MENKQKKYRLFGIINIIDVLIVAAIIGVIYGAHLFAMPQQTAAEGGRLVRFTVELSGHNSGFYQQIEPGAVVIESSIGVPIGTIIYTYASAFMQDVPDEANNIIRRAEVEGREFTYVVIETMANISEFETEVNNFRLMVGRSVYVRSRDFAGEGHITALEFL